MHEGPELDERRRGDDGCAPEAHTAAHTGLPISVDDVPIASAIPAWLSASFASVAAAACGGGTESAANAGAAQTAGTPTAAAPLPAPTLAPTPVSSPSPAPAPAAPATPTPSPAPSSPIPAPSPSPSPSPAPAPAPGPTPAPNPAPVPPPITSRQASRFLTQASMGATREQIARVQTIGYSAWLDEQFALPREQSRWDYLMAAGYNADTLKNGTAGFDPAMWKKLIASSDTLRQRVTLALSEILVTGIDGLVGASWKQFSAAAYADMLEKNAFGNYRTLLLELSRFPAMGQYLTFRGNAKANATTGSQPDENYARELMQLFTIGLVQLNGDGSVRLLNGAPVETYGQDDISGLARVFTGWDFDTSAAVTSVSPQEFLRVPLVQVASRYEAGAKNFLGTTIPAGTEAVTGLTRALDTIFVHANVGPFVSRQLIQRLVTSNPSGGYVGRVAAAFANDGTGVRGSLKAVLKAILLDPEARDDSVAAGASWGKLREPVLRFLAWARAYGATSPSDAWAIGSTADPATRFGQSPGRSGSVFNFFRPGYVPPNSGFATPTLVAPEFQITNESSVVGYVNFMQRMVSTGIGDVKANYAALLPLASDSAALLDEINLVLAAGSLSVTTLASLKSALDAISAATDAGRNNRIYAALTLVTAAPEFIAQK